MTEVTQAPPVLLRATGIRVRRAGVDVLHDVSFEVAAGEVVAILGPNGAGKSTLLDTLGGILKPAAGTVERHGRVATVMQTPGLARRSAQANVELALAWWHVPYRQRRGRAREALESMRAGHLAKRPAAALSGGERRRVHLARAVALRPDILLLDEPFAGLDAESQAALRDDAASALRTSAGAVVLVVHDRAEAWALADRLVVMFDGRVAAHGRPHEILADPPTADVARFLGYDGELVEGESVRLTRPAQVRIVTDTHAAGALIGTLPGTVGRVVQVEDGARVEVVTATGRVQALTDLPAPGVGEHVRVRVTGGAVFPASQGRPRPDPELSRRTRAGT